MGSKLKTLSGKDVVSILSSFGFSVFSQKGSHIKLKRVVIGNSEVLIVPNHNPISKGTLKGIFNQASEYIPKQDLYSHFYTN